MKKGPLEFKQPKFWEERDGGLIPAHRTVSFAKRGIEIQVRSMGRGASPPLNSHREIGDLACV
jgi:hypothetical protein